MKQSIIILLFGVATIACSPVKKSEESNGQEEIPVVSTVTADSDSAYVFFKYPADGATVPSPVYIEMGVAGMQIEPAGEVNDGFGHHHILINQASWPSGEVIPMSDSTLHFGKGQTDTSMALEPGEYTLSLQFADGVHASYGKPMATSIKVTVE